MPFVLVDRCNVATWVIFKSARVAGLRFSDDCMAWRPDHRGDDFEDRLSVGRQTEWGGFYVQWVKRKCTQGHGDPWKSFSSPFDGKT